MEQYAVVFAKIVETKNNIELGGVYFGGLGDTIEEADSMARDCVNTVRGGTIMPRVVKVTESEQLVDLLIDASEKYEQIVAQMVEADRIASRPNRKKNRAVVETSDYTD